MPGALEEAHQPAASLSSSSSPPKAHPSSSSASASASTSTKAPRRSLSFKRLRSRSRVQAEDVKVADGVGVAADVAAVKGSGKSTSGGETAAAAAVTASSSLRPPLPTATKSAQGRLEGGSSNTAAAVTAAAISNHLTAATTSPSAMPSSSSFSPSTIPTPPAWPKTAAHCACYCEENAYLLAQDLLQRLEKKIGRGGGGGGAGGKVDKAGWRWDVWVVVVSNEGRMVLLWQQKASTSATAGHPVVWDYHVFVVVTAEHQSPAAAEERKASPSVQRPTTAPEAAAAAALQPGGMAKLEKQPSQRRRRANSLFRRRKATAAPPLPDDGRAGFSFDGTFIPAPVALPATSGAAESGDGWHAWVYDADSVLCWRSAEEQRGAAGAEREAQQAATATPIPFTSYMSQTFGLPSSTTTPATLLPTFRLTRAEAFLDNFSSDRSHMLLPPLSNGNGEAGAGLDVKPRYTVAPPTWRPIVGPRAKRKGWGNNLMAKWVEMSAPPNEAAAAANGDAHGGGAPDLRVQFGKVMDRQSFGEGRWEMPEWRRTAKGAGGGGIRRGPIGIGLDGEEQPPSIERVSSYHEHRRRRQRSASAPGNAGKDGGGEGDGAGGAVGRGGRVTSPLFPAYLHDVLQARATRKRDSYLALKVGDGEGEGEGEGGTSADTKVNGRS